MSLTDDLLDAARTAARHGGWRLVYNPTDKRVLVPVGRPDPNGLTARRLVWLAQGGHYEYTTIVSDTVWLPTVPVLCAVVVELGDTPNAVEVVAHLMRSVVTGVEGCARAAGHPDARLTADNLVVLSGSVLSDIREQPPELVDHPDAADKQWERHSYAIGLGVIAAKIDS